MVYSRGRRIKKKQKITKVEELNQFSDQLTSAFR